MNAHEHGRKLSQIVSGTIGVLAVVAASALGLHSWADAMATKAAVVDSSTSSSQQSVDTGSDDSGDWSEEDDERGDDDSSVPSRSAPVTPGNGQAPSATTTGS